jgi:methylmalonyl-CoA/ethylmalonyl-CoA epimerase
MKGHNMKNFLLYFATVFTIIFTLFTTLEVSYNNRRTYFMSDISKFGLAQIGQIAVPVEDIDRATAFYRDILGMSFLFQAPPGLGFFDCAGVRLMLDAPAKAQSENCSPVIYYKVLDINSAFETLSARGVVFEAKPHLIAKLPDHELWMAFFRDPDKNLLALMTEVR